ncbi:MAG: ATP synthase F1 subunit gamma [Planctomycetes bacterium]|nr:ATP synthase F1 subunit gamma [Planctomycetota bacterium]
MAKAKAILKRRRSVRNTRKITKTMQMLATAKFRQAADRMAGASRYRDKVTEIMNDLARAGGKVEHPLLVARPVKRRMHVIITSNRGLCGGYNGNIVREAVVTIRADRDAGVENQSHLVGKKGLAYMRAMGHEPHTLHTHFGDTPRYPDVLALANSAMEKYERGEIDALTVTWQKYFSLGRQKPHTEQILPVTAHATADEKAEAKAATAASEATVDYIFEPDAPRLLASILPLYVRVSLFTAFQEAVVGESLARMVAMKNATENADEMIKALTRRYNRARQSQITSEICDLMGGVEALK